MAISNSSIMNLVVMLIIQLANGQIIASPGVRPTSVISRTTSTISETQAPEPTCFDNCHYFFFRWDQEWYPDIVVNNITEVVTISGVSGRNITYSASTVSNNFSLPHSVSKWAQGDQGPIIVSGQTRIEHDLTMLWPSQYAMLMVRGNTTSSLPNGICTTSSVSDAWVLVPGGRSMMSQPYVNSYIYSWFESHGISITSKTCMINGSGGPPVANIAVGALTVISTVYHGNFDPPAEPSSRHSQFQPPDATHSLQMPTEPEKSTTSAEPDTRPQPAPTIIGGVPVIVIPTKSAVVVGTQTLDPGEGTFYSGTLVSLLPSEVVVGTDTYSLPASPATSKPSVLSMAGNEITADTNGAFIVGSQTLAPGMGKVTIDGSTFEIVSTGGAVIVDGETRTLAPAAESTDVGRSSSSNAILTGTAAETKAKAIWILGIILMVQIYGLVI